MWSNAGAACLGVSYAGAAQAVAERYARAIRKFFQQTIGLAVQSELCCRERARRAALFERPVEQLHRFGTRGCDCNARFRHFRFKPIQPRGIARAEFEQPRAFAHCSFIACVGARVACVEAEGETIEEAPPSARTLDKEPIHRRREPKDLHDLGEVG